VALAGQRRWHPTSLTSQPFGAESCVEEPYPTQLEELPGSPRLPYNYRDDIYVGRISSLVLTPIARAVGGSRDAWVWSTSTGIELLDRRVLPAVTATFARRSRVLRVLGDEQDNTIVVSRDAGGTILVNHGAVAIQGGTPTVSNTTPRSSSSGRPATTTCPLDETNGPLPAAALFGGDGNDVLIGGAGDDFVEGDAGNDTVFLGAGDDTFGWNPGDGSDTVDGRAALTPWSLTARTLRRSRYLGPRQSRPVHPRRRRRHDGPRWPRDD